MLQQQKQKTRLIKKRNVISLILIALMWCITIEPNVVVVNKYRIQDKNLKGIKIVFAGDFHIKPYQEKRLQYIVNKISAQKPDIVLLIGDYVNMHEEEWSYPISKTAEQLSKIESKYGIYTVLGNHDYYKEGKKIQRAMTKAGITVLENECKKISINEKTISIAGIEDLITGFPSLKKALRYAESPTILLSHQPDIYPLVPKSVNLTLAGHTHGGQVVIPFKGPVVVPSQYGTKYAYGYFEENGKKMIVTKGLGTSILPIRFNCTPEIVVIEFE